MQVAAQRHPGESEVWFVLGRALGMADRDAEAEPAFRRAAQLRPEMPDSHLNLALSLEYQGKRAEALDALRDARRLHPANAAIADMLLRVLLGILQDEPGGLAEPDAPLVPLGPEPLVSVIIPTRGRSRMLSDAIASVLRQSYERFEVLVANDGGEDVSPVLESVRQGGARRLELFTLPAPLGAAGARNRLLREARGDLVAFLDDDDLHLPNHLEAIVVAMRNTRYAFAYTRAAAVEERIDGGRRLELRRGDPRRYRVTHPMLLVRNLLPPSTWALRRECLERVGTFDETLACAEDWDLLLRISRRFELLPVEQMTAEIRVRPGTRDSVTERVPLGPTSKLLYRRYPSGGHALIELGREVYLASVD